LDPRRVTPEIDLLTFEEKAIPYGILPVNAYVLKASQPVLIDGGMPRETDAYRRALEAVIDPEDLRWVWVTHSDQDHVGLLEYVLAAAPRARVVLTYASVGRISAQTELPPDRLYLVRVGDRLDIGDRELVAVQPPLFDSPGTIAAFDTKSRALFSSDCFGGLLPRSVEDAAGLSAQELRDSQVLWACADAPWLHLVDKDRFSAELKAIRDLGPELVLSAHLPPARSLLDGMIAALAEAPDAEPFAGLNQAEVEALLQQMAELTASA
jgi:glyoxylase-like metal-dependent hydrolase (beta-lactamase superfamily II)